MMSKHLKDHEVLYRTLGVQQLLNLNDVILLLRSEVKRAGSQRVFARKVGENVSVVSKTLRGIVLPSEKILSGLNLRVVYLSKWSARQDAEFEAAVRASPYRWLAAALGELGRDRRSEGGDSGEARKFSSPAPMPLCSISHWRLWLMLRRTRTGLLPKSDCKTFQKGSHVDN
jgi:hypothetical protein